MSEQSNQGCTCNDDCGEKGNQGCDCNNECAEKEEIQTDLYAEPHKLSNIKKVIGVVSGKGGVGKSLVTSMLAVTMNKKGYHTAILDADITGPSIPKSFGIKTKAIASPIGLNPITSPTGIDIMSINLLLENDTDPVIWRGPVIAGAVK
jgi:Mrp family chromosome partitioning ATPase